MTDREAFQADISHQQHEAEEAFARGDVGPRLAMWSHRDPVTLFAGLGPTRSGWSELEPMFRSVASRLSGGNDVTYELLAGDVGGEMAWTAGVLRFTASIDGAASTRYTLRLTHIYRREDGDWKVVHEHSDFQPPDHVTPPPL